MTIDETQNDRKQVLESNPILRYFEYSHLPDKLVAVSKPFNVLAWHIALTVPPSAERTTCLRKLLEAKDCAVRAVL